MTVKSKAQMNLIQHGYMEKNFFSNVVETIQDEQIKNPLALAKGDLVIALHSIVEIIQNVNLLKTQNINTIYIQGKLLYVLTV